MKILITGVYGQLGSELTEIIGDMKSEIGDIPEIYRDAEITGVDIDTLDLSNTDDMAAFAAENKSHPFDLIINCAAMTNVDACETDNEAALKGNAVAPRNIARLAELHGSKLIHVSTDYVFDGQSNTPYREWDLPAPVCVYGKSKWLGEKYVSENCPRAFIVRTSWLYGKKGNNFVRTIRKIASENESITVVKDQFGNPTNANDLAHHLLKIGAGRDYGIYHVTGNGICSWHEFAEEIVRLSGLKCEVKPVTSEEFQRLAPRPAYSAMEHLMLRATIGDEMRDWKEALASYIKSLRA